MFTADPKAATLVDDLSNIAAVSMQVRQTNALGTAIFDKTVAIGEFDNTGLTWADWSADAQQHFTMLLTAEETGQTMPVGKAELPIYIAFEAIPTVGDPIFLGSITTVIFEDGIGSSGAPIVGDPTYLTAEQSDARYQPRGVGAPDLRLDINSLTGGGASALDGIETVDLDVPYLVAAVIGETLKFYRLTAGTAAEASPGIIRPDDYAASSNEKIWTQVL
jgi:hypothetical protein